MSEPKTCSECGRSLDFLMSTDPNKPGLVGLLRGEGDYLTIRVVWLAVLLVVFGVALLVFKLT